LEANTPHRYVVVSWQGQPACVSTFNSILFIIGRDIKAWCLHGTKYNSSINSSTDPDPSAEPSACAGHASPLPCCHPRPHRPDPCHDSGAPTATADAPAGAPSATTSTCSSSPACAESPTHHRSHPAACEGKHLGHRQAATTRDGALQDTGGPGLIGGLCRACPSSWVPSCVSWDILAHLIHSPEDVDPKISYPSYTFP
jgi:hypothetical protein